MNWKERLKANVDRARDNAEQKTPQVYAESLAVVWQAFTEFKEALGKQDGYSGDFSVGDSQAVFRLNHVGASATFTIRIGEGNEPPYVFKMERADDDAATGGWRNAPDKETLLDKLAELVNFLNRA